MKKTFTYLFTTALLLTISAVVMAQDGEHPFVESIHEYTITPGSTSNNLTWSILEASGYTINSQGIVGSNSVANITWTAAGTYTLQFTEDDGTCSTVKQISVEVGTNTFDVATSNPSQTCNNADGQVNFSGSTATTSVTFTVDMATGNEGFNPNWEFAFTLTPGTGATITNVAASAGSLSGTGPYTLSGLTSASGEGTVNITMDVTGNIYSLLNVDLEITSAKELSYNTPDADNTAWAATQTINPVPNTTNIITD